MWLWIEWTINGTYLIAGEVLPHIDFARLGEHFQPWMWLALSLNVCLVVIEGFFSGTEIAIVSMDKLRLRQLLESGSKGARIAQRMLQQPERFLGTTLVGTNIAVVSGSVILTTVLSGVLADIEPLAQRIQFLVALLLVPFSLIFGEIVPKSVFQQYADTLVPIVAPLLLGAQKLLAPFVYVVMQIATGILRSIGMEKKERNQTLTREELKYLIRTDTYGKIADHQRKEMMQRVFEFKDTIVREIMVPLVNVVALEKDVSLEEAIQKIQESGFSRIPIYEDRIDNIIGVIRAFDLLRAEPQETTLDRFLRQGCSILHNPSIT